jgi:hypothetical protein
MLGGPMKHRLFLPPFNGLGDVERTAELALLAEEDGASQSTTRVVDSW